ncbi:ABC transporter substrate-binding protein [Bradyrhizobium macuxiense]
MSRMMSRSSWAALTAVLVLLGQTSAALSSEKKYDEGATDSEILIGNIAAYSGPASNLGVIGKTHEAYFRKINDEGGINGRKIRLISYDDGYSPPKAIEQARKLVENDGVLLIFNSSGTPSNLAIQKYLNGKKVPQLFVASGSSRWNDPENFPWTMGWQPSFLLEGRAYARYLLDQKPDAKIAVLYQNDDLGKDYLRGLKDGLGAKATMIVAEESYEVSEPTIDTHIVKLKASGADVFIDVAQARFAAQAIRKISEIGWKPLHIVGSISASIGTVMQPAGFDKSQGIISVTYLKDSADSQWDNDEGMRKFNDFMAKYAPQLNRFDSVVVGSYGAAQAIVEVLRRCGDNLTRQNVMKQASSLSGFRTDVMLPGISANTTAADFVPIKQIHLMRIKDSGWELFGNLIDAAVAR